MNKELKTLINNLEGCIGMFDYMLTPIENNLLLLYINELQQENEKLKEKIENRGDFIVEQRKKIEDELVDNIEDDVVLSGVLNHMDMLNITIDTQLKTIKLLKQENKELHNKIDEISDFIKENKIKRYRVIESEDYDEEILLDEDDITCLERIINDEYDYENR